jgi:hypothetical protein
MAASPGGLPVPIHDWTRVDAGLFHHFHQMWSAAVVNGLNGGPLPEGYYALIEQKVSGPEPDVIAVSTGRRDKAGPGPSGGPAVADPPRTRLTEQVESDAAVYARKANRISVRHRLGEVVAIIEIVSPGNKDSRNALRAFVEKATAFLRAGVHLLVIDLFPPTPRDPYGIHRAIADEFRDTPHEPPADKPLTLVGYRAAYPLTAYIEPVAVGDPLPDMPLFLTPDEHVPVPLEATYRATWAVCPEPIRDLVDPPAKP